MGPPRRSPEQVEAIVALHEAGRTQYQIARVVGCSQWLVWDVLSRAGLTSADGGTITVVCPCGVWGQVFPADRYEPLTCGVCGQTFRIGNCQTAKTSGPAS